MGKDNGSGRHGRVLVINPNSTEAVTHGIDAAMDPFRFADGPEFDCVTLAGGPPGIETQRHVDAVVGPICDMIEREDNAADAFVIACFSDPGLLSARETTRKPVFGIGAASYSAALLLGEKFGVIAILPASVERQRRAVRMMGLDARYAASLPVGIGAGVARRRRRRGTHDRGRPIADRWARRRCPDHGLRRHGRAPRGGRAGARRAGDRPDAGRRRAGRRRCPARRPAVAARRAKPVTPPPGRSLPPPARGRRRRAGPAPSIRIRGG